MTMSEAHAREIWRFTADQVLQMVDAGILAPEDPVELLDGELIQMAAQGPLHIFLVHRLAPLLQEAYATQAHVVIQSTIGLGPRDLPDPDLSVIRGTLSDYRSRLPTGPEHLLIVEVAVTSLRQDRRKAALYARGGVPEYWILDTEGQRLEVHSGPTPEGYKMVRLLDRNEEISPPGLDLSWRVADLLD